MKARDLENGVSVWGALSVGVIVFIGIVLLDVAKDRQASLAIALVIGIASALLYPRVNMVLVAASAKRFYAEGRNKGTLGRHRLTLTENGLREESEGGTRETRIDSIERIAEGKTHAFIYISALMAHVIPKNRITNGNLDMFLQELNVRLPRPAV